jgi:hypothetical protein
MEMSDNDKVTLAMMMKIMAQEAEITISCAKSLTKNCESLVAPIFVTKAFIVLHSTMRSVHHGTCYISQLS